MRLPAFIGSTERLQEEHEIAQERTLAAAQRLEAIVIKLEKFSSEHWAWVEKEIIRPEQIAVALDGHIAVDIVNGQLDNAKGLIVRGQINELTKLMATRSILEGQEKIARDNLYRERKKMDDLKAKLEKRTKKGPTNG